ncbi:MAG TPA: hypothetical protein VFH66_02645 [Mycobacteriales bacterium]|nr:hypothetical protein [Mycobacteriales bacterium]
MKRALVHLLAGALVAAGGAYAMAADGSAPASDWTGLRAGVGVADATWHVGAGAGQYASDNIPNDASNEWDPNVQHVKQASSYGVASRLSMRAIVLQDGQGHAPIALLKVDNYLAQDYLTRRIAAILAADGSKVTYNHILMSATHDHNSPYYSTPSWGVWAFQDVMDLRMFEYQARAGAAAIEQAERSMVPARVGATTVQYPDFQGNIAGQDLDNQGAPAGYPVGVNDHGLVVMRFDQRTADQTWKPLATYVNYAEHGESLNGTDLISEDWWAPFQRYVDRATGVPVVFSQGSVGSAEGPYDRYGDHTPTTTDGGDTVYKIWAHENFAQAERGTHLLAEKVVDAWNAIGNGDPSVQVPYETNPVVDMLTHWVAGPLSHPYPSVGNCRTQNSVDGDPGVPAAGLPDCQRGGLGQQTSPLYENLKKAGLPLPDNYDATAFTGVEENLRIKLQAVRIGDTLLASCSCEAQSDLIKNLESRTDATTGNIYDGFDYANAADVADAWPGQGVQPCRPVDDSDLSKGYDCPNPTGSTGDYPNWLFGKGRITVSQAAFDHMEAEIHNDANGWNDPSYVAQANSEPTNLADIKGNFTKTELGADHDGYDYSSPDCQGYALSVGLGHTGDYDGYTVSYREYMARDAYRKALTSYGAHTADYMVTNLVGMAANLRCGTPLIAQPTDPLAAADEQRQAAAAAALGQLSSFYYDTWNAQIPDNAGPARPLQQPPATVQRFDAVQFRWVGGDNWTDNPTVKVQQQDANGNWVDYADQSGEIQVVLDNPATSSGDFGLSGLAGEQLNNRAGRQEWHWRASFEVFDSYPRADVPGGQVPNGTYRFVVDGHIHQAGAATPYELASDPFTVTPWTGITAGDLRRDDATHVSFVIAPIAYPRTPKTTDGIAFYKDDPGFHLICTTCTFRPWATTSTPVSAIVEVHCANGKTKQVAATYDPSTGRWVATVASGVGVTWTIPAGGIRDAYGETNGQPVGPAT